MECLKCLCSCKGKDKKEGKTQQVTGEQDRVRVSNLRAFGAFAGPARQPTPEEEEANEKALEAKAHAAKTQQTVEPKKRNPPEAKVFTFGRDSSPTRQPNSGGEESAKRYTVNSGSVEAERSTIRTPSLSSSPYGFLPPPSVGVSPAAAASADANMDATMNMDATGFDYSHNHNVYQAERSVNGMTPIEQAQEASIIDSGLPSLHHGT